MKKQHLIKYPVSRRQLGRRHRQLSRRRHKQLAAHSSSCSDSPRWMRGTIGFIAGSFLGGLAGTIVGGAIAVGGVASESPRTVGAGVITSALLGLAGGGVGIWIGARKPEC